MPAKAKGDAWAGLSIEGIIDHELGRNHEIRDGASAYANILSEYRVHRSARKLLLAILDLAAWQYRQRHARDATLLTFSDGAASFLFDASRTRSLMIWGVSKQVAPNTRDKSYHDDFPRARDGYDKGHAWAHGQGGQEGGPNYFEQARQLNQGRSQNGKLWRAIERHLAANAGLKAFIRLHYQRGNQTELPDHVEYGILPAKGLFRAVVFPNT